MSSECPSLPECGFMRKWGQKKDLACQGFIARYCKGALQTTCKRKEFKMQNNRPPSDNMMPNGTILS